jgi:hypothetical protein
MKACSFCRHAAAGADMSPKQLQVVNFVALMSFVKNHVKMSLA